MTHPTARRLLTCLLFFSYFRPPRCPDSPATCHSSLLPFFPSPAYRVPSRSPAARSWPTRGGEGKLSFPRRLLPRHSVSGLLRRSVAMLPLPNDRSPSIPEYLHDKRYVLLEQYEELRGKRYTPSTIRDATVTSVGRAVAGEIGKLWILVAVSFSVAVSSLLLTGCLFARKLSRWDKMRATVRRAFAGKWIKVSGVGVDRSAPAR